MNSSKTVESGTTAGGHNYRIVRDTRPPSRPAYWIEYQKPSTGKYVSLGKYETLDEAMNRISEINERQKRTERQRTAYRENALETLKGQIKAKAITAQSLMYSDDNPQMIEAIETACHYLIQASKHIEQAKQALVEQDPTP